MQGFMGLGRRLTCGALVAIGAVWLATLGGCDGADGGVDHLGAGGAGVGGQHDDGCAPLPLAEACEDGCPASPDEVQLFCTSDFRTTTRGLTECGGTYVHLNYGLGYTTYYFDENDALIGILRASDAGDGCEESNGPITTTYGETCRATGDAVDLCEGSAGAGGAGGVGAR